MKYITYLITIIFIILTLFNFNIITDSISLSFNICINNLLPSLIPFLLISNIIVKKNLLVNNTLSTTLLCIISGSPSNAKYISNYINYNIISIKDSQKLINYLQYVNPIYILNVIGLLTLNNKKYGLIILVSNIISSLILKVYYGKIEYNNHKFNNETLFNTITNSIKDTINTVLYIIGIITCFFIITSYIDIIININKNYKFIYGIIEITQGINYLKDSNINIYLKTIIASFLISFGGLSIHLQVFGILDNKKIRYKSYFFNRIIHSLISILVTSILFYILN